jgi:sortase A
MRSLRRRTNDRSTTRLDSTEQHGYGDSVDTVEPAALRTKPRLRIRLIRMAGTALIVVGVSGLVWAGVVWRWNDPLTSLWTHWQQHRLAAEHDQIMQEFKPAREPTPHASPTVQAAAIARSAARLRSSVSAGAPIGTIIVPRLGLKMLLINGTGHDDLTKGPGRDERTYMPGQGRLVYIAGHRTTYGAPFAHIDRLRPGDTVTLEMPYGTFVYSVTGKRIVDAGDLSVLRSPGHEVVALQACHPRFFATQRYIVWARPVRIVPVGGVAFIPRTS